MTNNFVTKDSGERVEFATGALRDTQDGKARPDLITPEFLLRLGELLARGAKKYGERNFEKGQNVSRGYASALRHLLQYASGDREEDHLAAVAFNVMSIMTVEERVATGLLPELLLDLPFYQTKPQPAFDRQKLENAMATLAGEGEVWVKLHLVAYKAYGYFEVDGTWENFVSFIRQHYADHYEEAFETFRVTMSDVYPDYSRDERKIRQAIISLVEEDSETWRATETIFRKVYTFAPSAEQVNRLEQWLLKKHPACYLKDSVYLKWDLQHYEIPF